MREILFRGKRLDTGEWEYSDVYKSMHFVVEPETIGQYTCKNDKNSNKLFEGDIIMVITIDDQTERICEVRFGEYEDYNSSELHYGFYIKFENIAVSIMQLEQNYFEIIGNIYDNPELLEVNND